jgi:hypothetical protein
LGTKGFIFLKEEKQWTHNKYYEPLLLDHSVTKGHSLLHSCPEWVLLCLLSWFPHLCWVPTDSFHQNRPGQGPLPPFPADRFQEALDSGNRRFSVGHSFKCEIQINLESSGINFETAVYHSA